MTNIFLFLKESDSEAIRRSHRRRARELAVGLSQQASVSRSVVSKIIQSGPAPQRTVVSRLGGKNTDTLLVTPTGGTSGSSGSARKCGPKEEDTVRALMDLSLPQFTRLEDGRLPKAKSWPITEQPPSSPAGPRDGNRTRTPSPCYQLDGLTTASSTGGSVKNDYRLTISTDSSNSPTPVGSILSISDDDLPMESEREDKRKVQRRELDDDVQLGPTEVPDQSPDDTPVYAPTPVDCLIKVPISGDGLSPPEGVTRTNKIRPITLIRKPIPKIKPSSDKPYGLRPREKPIAVPEGKEQPVEGWQYEVSHNNSQVNSDDKDEMFGEGPVGNPKHGTRPVLVKMKAPCLSRKQDKLPVDTTASERISRLGPIAESRKAIGPSLKVTNEVQSGTEGCDSPMITRRLVKDDEPALMSEGGSDAGTGSRTGPPEGEMLSQSVRQLHRPPPPSEVPDWSDGESLIIIENPSVPSTPRKAVDGLLVDSEDVVQISPGLNSSKDPGVLSAPLSPNRVRQGHSQDMPAECSLFDVSPDLPGFHMRPAGCGVQQTTMNAPPPPNYVGFDNPFFESPIAFAQCQNTAGMDTTTTLPVYNIPRNCNIGVGQSSVPTVYASGVSADSIPWSTAEEIIRDIAREGPFDVDIIDVEKT